MAAQVYERTGEDGKVWVASRLSLAAPHVYIDDNSSICQEARRTNALVVEVNKRTRVLGFVEGLQQLASSDQLLQPRAFVSGLPIAGASLSATLLGQRECCQRRTKERARSSDR